MFGCLFFHFDVGWYEMYANYALSLATAARSKAIRTCPFSFFFSW
jgi:hypothetical protein